MTRNRLSQIKNFFTNLFSKKRSIDDPRMVTALAVEEPVDNPEVASYQASPATSEVDVIAPVADPVSMDMFTEQELDNNLQMDLDFPGKGAAEIGTQGIVDDPDQFAIPSVEK